MSNQYDEICQKYKISRRIFKKGKTKSICVHILLVEGQERWQ